MEHELVLLCPDGAWKAVMESLLQRPQSLGIRPVSFRIVVDPLHDSSSEEVEILRPFLKAKVKALVVRDLHGSGKESLGDLALEQTIVDRLQANGWGAGQVSAIVADPEIESWLRFDSPHMGQLVKERARRNRAEIDAWRDKVATAIARFGGLSETGKPRNPKEVFTELTKGAYGIPTSTSLLAHLASLESLKGCRINSFNRFVKLMTTWFPRS